MRKILECILAILVIFPIAFLVSWGIVEGWVLFWEYGWIYNELTVPPLVLWDIFFTNIVQILILACILTPIVIVIIGLYLSR